MCNQDWENSFLFHGWHMETKICHLLSSLETHPGSTLPRVQTFGCVFPRPCDLFLLSKHKEPWPCVVPFTLFLYSTHMGMTLQHQALYRPWGLKSIFLLINHKQWKGTSKEPNPVYTFLMATDQEKEGKQCPLIDGRLIKRTVSLTYSRGMPYV